MQADSSRGFNRDPDEILRQIKEAEKSDEALRGKLKIFFGYASGVGKTYAMLEEAHALKNKGVDVVAAYIEPHARPETLKLAEGLERVENRAVQYKGIELKELDTDAVLARQPQVALVDELAHTNAVGGRHKKRYQDVQELLHAGITVLTTVNVQHLEGLNDKVASITHIPVSERMPDYIFDQADMVELIDIEPDDLIERLQAGKVYVPERSKTALSNFFSKSNLGSLRETALRRMAGRMAKRSAIDPSSHADVGEDVLVLVTPHPENAKAIRVAAHMAEAYNGSLTAVVIEKERVKKLDVDEKKRLRDNLRLVEEMGGNVVTLQGDDSAALVAHYAVSAGISQLVVEGGTEKRRLPWRPSLPERVARLTYGGTVTLVKTTPGYKKDFRPTSPIFTWSAKDVFWALAAIAASTVAGLVLYEFNFNFAVGLMPYMLMAMLFAFKARGILYVLAVSIGSAVAYNYFFTAPRFTLNAYAPSYPVIFTILALCALLSLIHI